jgi:hypothetical protein
MAHIRCTLRPHFTGQIGPVRFRNGHGETSDLETLAYFRALPDEYDVDEPDEQPAPFIGPHPKPEDDTDPQE